MPNILTFDAAGRGTGWQTSKSQDKYHKWPYVRECLVQPTNMQIVIDGEGYREATQEEIAERYPPRAQSKAEAAFQTFAEQLGFDHKPTAEELEAAIGQMYAQASTVQEVALASATQGRLTALNNELAVRQNLAWEDWIWKERVIPA